MRSISWRSSGFFASGAVCGLIVARFAAPLWAEAIIQVAQDRYGELTYRCDSAMREHLLAKQRLIAEPTEQNVDLVDMAKLGLLDCQDYDLFRKRLIQLGLDENDLSYMGLRAIEERATTLQQVVENHEIRY